MGARRRRNDEASASMVSYTVAAAVFILGSSVLFGFVVEPPGASTTNLEQLDLRTQSTTALEVLLGTPGLPATWEGTTLGIDQIDRLGLIEQGTSIRIDADKFDALARGKYATASSTNGFVDYAEAKAALGLDGYEFHLRAYPLLSPGNGIDYGTDGMDDYRVAYVAAGDADGDPTPEAELEIAALEALDIGFDSSVREEPDGSGDVFIDDSHDIRDLLLPNIGASVTQTTLGNGAGTKYDFARVPLAVHQGLTTPVDLTQGVLALARDSDGDAAPDTLGYTKSRELRAIVGTIELESGTYHVDWEEWVDTDRGNGTTDCGDYGWAEYSLDDGATWELFSEDADDRSADCSTLLLGAFGAAPRSKSFEVDLACAPTCSMILAFHWLADNDNNIGYGWLVDDIHVYEDMLLSDDTTYFRKTFESPEYDMLIIGSGAEHNSFTPNEVKNGIRDYVDEYGGRLFVVGGQAANGEIQWLDRLFDVGIGGGSGGLAVPDTTHPLLTLPNELSYEGYPEPTTLFTLDDAEAELFSMIIGEDETAQALAVAREGAFGSGTSTDGSVMLSAYQPHLFDDEEERARFFANAVVYGKFHYLYLEVGPPIPEGEAIASAARSATMNMYRTGDPEYTEMAFIMYVWPGQTIDATIASTMLEPSAPLHLEATVEEDEVTLTWEEPVTWGTGSPMRYDIYRGTTLTPDELVGQVDHDGGTTYTETLDGADLGVTQYYLVRAVSDTGETTQGLPSEVVSAVVVDLPDAPTVTAEGVATSITLSWPTVWSPQTGNLYGHAIYASTDGATYALVGEIGNATTYTYTPPDTGARTYKVAAYNARGYGPQSAASDEVESTLDIPPPELAVAAVTPGSLTLTWVAPDAGAHTLTGYRIWRSDTGDEGSFAELTQVGLTLTYTDSGLSAATAKWYKVQAVSDAGDGQASEAQTATTHAALGAPVVSVTATLPGQLTLTWVAPDAGVHTITGYRIYRADSAAGPFAELAETGVVLTYADTGLATYTQKWYKVQAITTPDEAELSAVATGTTWNTPGAPVLIATRALTTATISWTAPLSDAPITSYQLWKGNSATNTGTFVKSVSAATLLTTDTYSSSAKYYRVYAVSGLGNGAWSNGDDAST